MSVNSLGSFTFIRMDADGQPDGLPPVLQREHALVQRPGVPGTGVIDLATRGQPFSLSTIVDVTSLTNAEALRKNYLDAVIEDKLDLIRAGINYTSVFDTQYVILRLQACQIRTTLQPVGGLNTGRFLVAAQFILLPVFP